ncbi:ribosomal protein S19 [Xylaria sp. FL1777]|nr:ribosomal protein S19 [Xylaria sp. FL1777]
MQPTRWLLKGRSVWKVHLPLKSSVLTTSFFPNQVRISSRKTSLTPLSSLEQSTEQNLKRTKKNFLKEFLHPLLLAYKSKQHVEISKTKILTTQARAATILPNFVGLQFQVYNGKVYNDVTITEDMVGHKLGEFSPCVATAPKSISPGGFFSQFFFYLVFAIVSS